MMGKADTSRPFDALAALEAFKTGKGLRWIHIAEKIGVSHGYFHRLRCRKMRPSVAVADRLCELMAEHGAFLGERERREFWEAFVRLPAA